MLVLFVAVPSIVCNGERSRAFKHNGYRSGGDLHDWRFVLGSSLELFICDAMRNHAALV